MTSERTGHSQCNQNGNEAYIQSMGAEGGEGRLPRLEHECGLGLSLQTRGDGELEAEKSAPTTAQG